MQQVVLRDDASIGGSGVGSGEGGIADLTTAERETLGQSVEVDGR